MMFNLLTWRRRLDGKASGVQQGPPHFPPMCLLGHFSDTAWHLQPATTLADGGKRHGVMVES